MFVDAHTDVLWKMLRDNKINFYNDNDSLRVNYDNMVKGNLEIQVFAIFVSTLKTGKFEFALQSVDDFYQKINTEKLQIATSFNEIESILRNGNKVGILSLEGADAIEGDLGKLRTFYRLGVRAMGLTWNFANAAADGVQEKRGSGLSNFGYDVIEEMNRLGMIIDISHLSEKGFWDVIEVSKQPINASHSNAKNICNHPRNLTDGQINALINTNGMIGVTYVCDFTSKKDRPTVEDLLPHIEHIAELGGIKNIGLGSDFDGATTLVGLENPGQIEHLANLLYKKYSTDQAKGILGDNWFEYYRRVLPKN